MKLGTSSRGAIGLALCGLAISVLSDVKPATAQATKIVAKGETVRVMEYPATIGVGQELIWVAKDKGFCESHGLRCELVKIANGALGIQAMTAGSIDFNLLTTDFNMQAAARGVDMQIVVGTNPKLFLTLAARKSVPLPNRSKGYPEIMRDLKGLKIGVAARGAATEIATRALLNGAGMSADDVTFVPVGPPSAAYAAFVAGTVDAAMSWSPFPEICEINDTCVPVVKLAESGPDDLRAMNGAVEVMAAMRSYIKANPIVVQAFIQAMQEAAAWINKPENFDEFVKITKAHFTLGDLPRGDEVIGKVLRAEQRDISVTIDRKAVQASADYLLKYKVIDKPFDISKFVYEHAPKP